MKKIEKKTIIRASEGDIEAFREIYDLTSSYVFTIAYRIVQSREDADEVTQDAFVRAHQNLADFRHEASFETWLYRITVNLALNVCKKRKSDVKKQEGFQQEVAVHRTATKPTQRDQLNREGAQQNLEKYFRVLNPEQRACLTLRHLKGMNYQEIAKTLEININTVRSRLKRAREKLMSLGKEKKEAL